MLGLGRNGFRRIIGHRGFSAALQSATSINHQNLQSVSVNKAVFQKNNSRKPLGLSTPREQIKLQEKYKENLQNNKLETLHDAVEYVEWRGNVYPHTMQKIVRLLENANDLNSFSDRQLSVILSVFGSKCDTVSKKVRAESLEKVEKILQSKGIKLSLQSRNKIIECKIDNRSEVDVLKELRELEEAGIEADSETYALLCEVYAKQANTKAITDIITHMKMNNIPLAEDHVAQLVYSIAKSGNDAQANKVIETFSKLMNVVRLRCAAARAIIEREKNEVGRGGFEVIEMLRTIPSTAKVHSLENNIYVINILMDLIEVGQFNAFNLLSSYLMVSPDGKHLAENHLNRPVVARSKSMLSEGNIAEAITLYSCVNPTFSNDFFLKDLNQQFENKLKTLEKEDFDAFLKVLVLAENKKLIPNVQELLLSSCAKYELPAFPKIFEYVKNSGNLRDVLTANHELKRSLAKHLGHQLIKSESVNEKAELLADIASVLFAPTKKETYQEMFSYYTIIYKLANKDVKLVIPAIELITGKHEQKEFCTAIIQQLLRNFDNDHLAVDKLSNLINSNKVEQIMNNRVQFSLTKLLIATNDKTLIKLVAKILALEFPPEANRNSGRFSGINLAKFLSNEMISNEKAEQLIGYLENEGRASLTVQEIAEVKEILKDNPKKKELIGRLKKSQTMTRWKASSVEELLSELKNFNKDAKPVVVNTLRDIIIQKTLVDKKDDLPFIVQLLEQTVEWRREIEENEKTSDTKRIKESIKNLENSTLTKAVYANDMILADRIWLMRSGHFSADVLLAYASKLFLNNQKERADQVCEDLRLSTQPVRPVTLEKTGRKLKGVDIERMGELSEYLGKQFNLSHKNTRRIVAQVKLDQLNELIKNNKLTEALQMAVEETKESGRAFGQVPIMIEAIKENNRKVLESIHTMVKNAHNLNMANINLAYALLYSNHVAQAKQLIEKQNLEIDSKVLQYFITLGVSSSNVQVLKNLFIVFNGRASTLQLNNLLEIVTRLLWKNGNIEELNELDKEIELTSFPLQNKLRQFFDDLKEKYSNIDDDL